MTLDHLEPRLLMKVAKIRLESEEAAWVRAVGIFEGETIEVLRHALFGGPLHVRTGCGGEFALDRSLAAAIDVEPSALGEGAP